MIEVHRPRGWWTLAAAAWALLFALPSFYWATGSEAGIGTIAADPEAALDVGAEPAALVAIGIAKLVLAVLLLWLPRSPLSGRRGVRVGGWILAVGLVLYGAANFVDHLLMLTGVRGVPEALGETAVRWHALLWDPYWILGGLLIGLAVRSWNQDAARERGDALDQREGVPG